MKWHLFQFEAQLYLATHIKNVCEHVAKYHQRDSYHVIQLDDNSMIKTHDGIFNIDQLTAKMQKHARKNGYQITNTLSIFIRNGKAITISRQCEEMMG